MDMDILGKDGWTQSAAAVIRGLDLTDVFQAVEDEQ